MRASDPGDAAARGRSPSLDAFLAWYFVTVWGSGFVATKIGLQSAAPFTFLSLRYVFGIALMVPVVLALRPRWPRSRAALGHVIVAGLLMHAVNLSGSHYAQYLGLSAGIVALLLAAQPLLTAVVAARWMHERLAPAQWAGVALGLAGVLLVVWHKIDARTMTVASLAAVCISLAAATAGTLYQRVFCPHEDLRGAPLIQFCASLALVAPLAWAVEGFTVQWTWGLAGSIVFLVAFASVLATNALHTLMRHGQATRVTSIFYLTPVIAIGLELLTFGVVPTALSLVGVLVTCVGVALVAWKR